MVTKTLDSCIFPGIIAILFDWFITYEYDADKSLYILSLTFLIKSSLCPSLVKLILLYKFKLFWLQLYLA